MHLAGVVGEQPVFHVSEGEGVQQQDVGDRDRPDQSENVNQGLLGEPSRDTYIALLERKVRNMTAIRRKM